MLDQQPRERRTARRIGRNTLPNQFRRAFEAQDWQRVRVEAVWQDTLSDVDLRLRHMPVNPGTLRRFSDREQAA